MKHDMYSVIRRPLLTEKSLTRSEEGQYAFEVQISAGKDEVRRAVERIFDVRVVSVNTSIQRGKKKRIGRTWGKRPNWKKAVVTLADGQFIDFFQGA